VPPQMASAVADTKAAVVLALASAPQGSEAEARLWKLLTFMDRLVLAQPHRRAARNTGRRTRLLLTYFPTGSGCSGGGVGIFVDGGSILRCGAAGLGNPTLFEQRSATDPILDFGGRVRAGSVRRSRAFPPQVRPRHPRRL
jgi:hypothetical protein